MRANVGEAWTGATGDVRVILAVTDEHVTWRLSGDVREVTTGRVAWRLWEQRAQLTRSSPAAADSIPAWALQTVAHLPACVSLEVAARELSLGVNTIRRYARDGRLKVLPTAPGSGGGGRVLVARVEIARFLAVLSGDLEGGAPGGATRTA